jgi:hypothetical protein
MNKRLLTAATLAGLLLVGLLHASPASAAPGRFCNGPRVLVPGVADPQYDLYGTPALSADGRWAAFASTADLTGGNPGEISQIFLYDLADGSLDQVTAGVADDDPDPHSRSASISADGGLVAFSSTADLTGDNPDQGPELFLYERATDTTVQLLAHEGSTSPDSPVITADGSRVVFRDDTDLTGGSPGPGADIYSVDVDTLVVEQLTSTGADEAWDLLASADGGVIAYTVFGTWFEVRLQAGADEPIEVTDWANDTSWARSLSADGNRLVVESWRSFGEPGTPDHPEYMIAGYYDTETHQLVQIMHDRQLAPGPRSSISPDGSTIFFTSFRDLTGDNPSGLLRQMFRYDVESGRTTQVGYAPHGDYDGAYTAASASGDTGEVVWISSGFAPDRADLVGMSCTVRPRDVSAAHPFVHDIVWMGEQGISTGYSDGTYRPSAAVTRQAMAAFLHRLAGAPEVETPEDPTFADVSTTHPFFAEVEWMAAVGISTGTPGTPKPTFQPGAPVTRQAMAAFLHRLAGAPDVDPPAATTFSDVSTTHPFSAEIEWMAAKGISTGDPGTPKPTYRPAAPVTRQAMAAFLHRFADNPGIPDGP